MEAGERWIFGDVAGKPIRAWDSRDHQFRTAYDSLRRPTESYLREGAGPELLVGRTVYGESQPNSETSNLRAKVVQLFDQAGVVTSGDYDFKGNLLRSQRQLARGYKTAPNWSAAVPLEARSYIGRTRYDALNRPTKLTAPDKSLIHPFYNEANLLKALETNLRDAAVVTNFVTNINYNAKGQRTLIEYGNGVRTTYEYDPLTFRLIHLKTMRPANPDATASQWYIYDPAGNITRSKNAALKTVFHNNQPVEPIATYTYDALYRLIEAKGREHIGQNAFDFNPPDGNYRDYPFVGHRANPNDLQALRNYTESYEYDTVGNFEALRHTATNGNSARSYDYEEDSLLEAGK